MDKKQKIQGNIRKLSKVENGHWVLKLADIGQNDPYEFTASATFNNIRV